MSKHLKTALVSLGLIVLIIVSYVIHITCGFEGIYEFFGISNKVPYNYVKFIDVGQGDCTLIHSDGKYVLIDAGCNYDDGIALSRKLREYEVKKIECIIVSHDDVDHAGGIYKILNDFDVRAIVCSDFSFTDDESGTYNVVAAAEENDTEILSAEKGNKLFFGDAEFKFLWIDEETKSENNRSLVTRLTMDNKIFFFGGDISSSVEKRMIESGISVKCDILKASHHGSAYSTCDEFLDKARPAYCVVTCSADNRYGFPAEPFLSRINERDIILYTTAKDGDITFNTSEMKVSFKK